MMKLGDLKMGNLDSFKDQLIRDIFLNKNEIDIIKEKLNGELKNVREENLGFKRELERT